MKRVKAEWSSLKLSLLRIYFLVCLFLINLFSNCYSIIILKIKKTFDLITWLMLDPEMFDCCCLMFLQSSMFRAFLLLPTDVIYLDLFSLCFSLCPYLFPYLCLCCACVCVYVCAFSYLFSSFSVSIIK